METYTDHDATINHCKQMKGILGIVVLYKHRLDSAPTLVSLNSALEELACRMSVLVYDNSPTFNVGMSTQSYLGNLDLIYVADEANSGLSRAYNNGINLAVALSKPWLLLLDQDSEITSAFLVAAAKSLQQSNVVLHLPTVLSGLRHISPVRLVMGRSIGQSKLVPGVHKSQEFFAINSGMIVSRKFLESIGGYDEQFKVHLTDNWFCSIYERSGQPFAVFSGNLAHNLSRDTVLDPDYQLSLQKQSLSGYRRIYKNRPVHLLVLSVFAVFGAMKRSIYYRDLRFVAGLCELACK